MKIESQYYSDKSKGIDIKQLSHLPDDQRRILLFGTDEQITDLIRNIRSRERMQHIHILGEAALDLIDQERALIKDADDKLIHGWDKINPSLFHRLISKFVK